MFLFEPFFILKGALFEEADELLQRPTLARFDGHSCSTFFERNLFIVDFKGFIFK